MGNIQEKLIDLRSLPHDHPLRNTPISEVKPLYRFRGDLLKPKPCAHWKIGRSCYNDLEPFWGELGEFLIDLDSAPKDHA